MPTASEIAASIGAAMEGPDIAVYGARSLARAAPKTIVFLNGPDRESAARLDAIGAVVCVTTPALAESLACTRLLHDRPRLAFCSILAEFFVEPEELGISSAASLAPEARIGTGVSVGAGAAVGPAVEIGPGTRIGPGAVLTGRVEIGAECIVKSNATIGEAGFGFATGPGGVPVRFPHIGGVRIGDGVEVGANSTVARAALDETVIGDSVKMDDLVYIAHNVTIGSRSLIGPGACICGSVAVGDDVWIGPNATIVDHVAIGDGAHIGLGSLVMRSVAPGAKVRGNPARTIPGAGTHPGR